MKNKYFKLLFIYVICLSILFTIALIKRKNIFNKLVTLDDKNKVYEEYKSYVPVKIEFYNKRWGNFEINEKKTIEYVHNFMNSLPKLDADEKEIYKSKLSSQIEGTIFYLNDIKEEFYIGKKLIINGFLYGDKYSEPDIDYLKSYLNEILYLPEKVAYLINENNSVELVSEKTQKVIKLTHMDKEKVKNTVKYCEKILNVNNLKG